MLAIFVSLGIGGFLGILMFYFNFNISWCMSVGFLGFIATQILTGLLVRKLVKKLTNNIQNIIAGGQQKLNKKIQFFQTKPQGGMKTMQKLLEKDQHVFIRQAIEATKAFEKLYSWNLLLKKQVNTMRMQFYYQLREFEKVDELIPKAMYVDHMSVAMKMARLFKNGDESYKKLFHKKIKKFKGEDAVLLFALYSWILVKKGEIEEAIKVLQQGKEQTKNEVLEKNWESLVNSKDKKFSNSELGDVWYALYLEEVRLPKPKQQVMRGPYR